jgi:hypothetical protein
MVRDREKMSSVLDLASHKSIDLAKIFKNVFNNCKNAGLCNISVENIYTHTQKLQYSITQAMEIITPTSSITVLINRKFL